MPMIPSGDNLGNVLPRSGRTNIQGGNGALGRAMIGLGRDVQKIALKLEHDKEQTNQIEMRNAVLERSKQVEALKNSIDERVRLGELPPEKAETEYTAKLTSLPKQQIEGLNGLQQQTLNYYYDNVDYQAQKQVFSIRQNGVISKAQSTLENSFTLDSEELLKPNANFAAVRKAWDSEPVNEAGRMAHGEAWPKVKNQYLTSLNINYLQNQINHAANNENAYKLQQLKTDLMDDKKFTDLDALKRSQLINQIDPVLSRTVGVTYGKALANGLTDLTSLTGSYEAANVFNAMLQRESNGKQFDKNGQPLTSSAGAIGKAQVMPETAKAMAKELGVSFDEYRYKNDAEYNVMLGRAYFERNLKKYGSPLMAAAAYNAGDGAVDKWIKQFGDPRKGEISEAEFLTKIPYKETREYVQNVASRLSGGRKNKINKSSAIALIDDNPNLSYEQKQHARNELNKRITAQEQQAQIEYKALRDGVWQDVYLNGVSVDQIEPQRYAALSVDDRIALKKEAVKELDLPVWSEARGRVKSGEEFDILGEYSEKLPPANLKTLLDMQQDIANSADGPSGRARAEAFKIFNLDLQAKGIKNKNTLGQIWDNAYDEIEEFEKKNKRKATRSEILDISRRQFLTVQLDGKDVLYRDLDRQQRQRITNVDIYDYNYDYRGRRTAASLFGMENSVNQNSYNGIKSIPVSDRKEIESVLKSLGRPVTDDAVLKYYLDGISKR